MEHRTTGWEYVGEEIQQDLEAFMPPYAAEAVRDGLSGDADAAAGLCVRAPNEWRGQIALAAYYLGTPNPGYQEIIRSIWNHDPLQLVYAARRSLYYTASDSLALIRKMMKDAQFEHPFAERITVYRGTSGVGFDRARRGLSWTISRDIACWFAARFMTETKLPLVLTATVDPACILLYDDERGEQEVVFARSIGARVDPDPGSWPEADMRYQLKRHARNPQNWVRKHDWPAIVYKAPRKS